MAATGNESVSLSQLKEYMDNKLCPVNSLFLRIDDTSPASVYGGVWERLEEGFLYSSPTGSTGTFTFGTDGWAANQNLPLALRTRLVELVARRRTR